MEIPMMITREINGVTHSGAVEQLDLIEEYEVLVKDQKVTFTTDRGERVGKVIGYNLYGGGDAPWVLSLVIMYRKGEYFVKMDDVQLV